MLTEREGVLRGSLLSGIVVTAAGVVFLGSSLYAISAFANLPPLTIVGAMALFIAPVALVFICVSARGIFFLDPFDPRQVLYGLPLGTLLFLAPVSGMRSWLDNRYVVNLPSYSLEGGRGIHHDTAFHVTLIQGIMDFGYPTTGQHLNPLTPYHAATHYVDAGISLILQTNPWETYALFFYAKSVALILAILLVVYSIAKNLSLGLFLTLLFVTVVGITHGWAVSGSHSQWLAVFGLVLIAPATHKWILSSGQRWGSLLGLTIIFVLLMPTKVTTALGFAILVGLSLFFLDPRNKRIWALGLLWVVLFIGFYLLTGGFGNTAQKEPSRIAVFDSSYALAFASISLGILLFVLSRHSPLLGLRPMGLAGIVGPGLLAVVIFAHGAINTGDTNQFFVGFFYSQICVSVVAIARFLNEPQIESSGLRKLLTPMLAGALLLTISPLWLVPNSGYWTPKDIARAVIAGNTVTYETINATLPREERFSVFRQLAGQERIADTREPDDLISSLDTAVSTVLEENGLKRQEAYLLISKESFGRIENAHAISPWMTSLLIKAQTGKTLIHSLDVSPPHGPGTYGMNAYTSEAQRIPLASISPEVLCTLDKRVITAHLTDKWRASPVPCGR